MNGLLTIAEYRNKYGRAVSTIMNGIKRGRFPDAKKIGGKWFIPDDGTLPDHRIKTGKYIDRRKPKNDR